MRSVDSAKKIVCRPSLGLDSSGLPLRHSEKLQRNRPVDAKSLAFHTEPVPSQFTSGAFSMTTPTSPKWTPSLLVARPTPSHDPAPATR